MAMNNDQAWVVLHRVELGQAVTNGDVLDAVATLGLCPVPPVQPLESALLTTLVSQQSDLVRSLQELTAAIHRMCDMEDSGEDLPIGLNPRRA